MRYLDEHTSEKGVLGSGVAAAASSAAIERGIHGCLVGFYEEGIILKFDVKRTWARLIDTPVWVHSRSELSMKLLPDG